MIKLELEIINLRKEIDFFSKIDSSCDGTITKKYKSLINTMNTDLMEKENIIKNLEKKERFYFFHRKKTKIIILYF